MSSFALVNVVQQHVGNINKLEDSMKDLAIGACASGKDCKRGGDPTFHADTLVFCGCNGPVDISASSRRDPNKKRHVAPAHFFCQECRDSKRHCAAEFQCIACVEEGREVINEAILDGPCVPQIALVASLQRTLFDDTDALREATIMAERDAQRAGVVDTRHDAAAANRLKKVVKNTPELAAQRVAIDAMAEEDPQRPILEAKLLEAATAVADAALQRDTTQREQARAEEQQDGQGAEPFTQPSPPVGMAAAAASGKAPAASGKAPAAADGGGEGKKPKGPKKPVLKYKDMSVAEKADFDARKVTRLYNQGVKKNDAYRVEHFNRAMIKMQTLNEQLTAARIRNKKQRKKEAMLQQLVKQVLVDMEVPAEKVDEMVDEVDKRMGVWIEETLAPMEPRVEEELAGDEFVLPFADEEYKEEEEEAQAGEEAEAMAQ